MVDALFLDIQMPGLDGLSLRGLDRAGAAGGVRHRLAEHAVDAFELDAADFLLKPVTTGRLVKALAKIRRALGQREDAAGGRGGATSRYPVQAGSGLVFLNLARTAYFEVEDQVVWAIAGERFRTRWKTLGEVEAFFPDAGLLRIHRHLLIRPEAVLGLKPAMGGRAIVRLVGRRGDRSQPGRGAAPAEHFGLG